MQRQSGSRIGAKIGFQVRKLQSLHILNKLSLQLWQSDCLSEDLIKAKPMRINQKLLPVLFLPFTLLVGCGGGGIENLVSAEEEDIAGETDSGTDSGTDTTGSDADGVSYLPLMVTEHFASYSGLSGDNLLEFDIKNPLSHYYPINPVDSATLSSITNATASNYVVTVDGIEVDNDENYARLQPVMGLPVQLRTALVFDVSDSMSHVNIQALVDAAKAYVAAAQASSDPVIANQEYTVWAFAVDTQELTSGFSSNSATIEAAIDTVVTLNANRSLGEFTNLHQIIVESIGRYIEAPYDFATDGDNDLEDVVNVDGVELSQLVVFSSGRENVLRFDAQTMTNAIRSQSFVKYTGASTASTFSLYKPVFYYVMGAASNGLAYETLGDLAEQTVYTNLTGAEYDFASTLVAQQQAAIAARIDLSNMHLYRHSVIPREGDHTLIFQSNSTQNSYSLTVSIEDADIQGVADVTPEAEVFGPNGEYLSNGQASLASVQTFTPATLWTNDIYGASDYSWNLTNGSGALNADGSFTVSSITAPATLQLTNTTLGISASITIND